MTTNPTPTSRVVDLVNTANAEHEAELARLIKRAAQTRGWCSTRPATIARYLLAHGVTLPTREDR